MTIEKMFDVLKTYNMCCALCREPERFKVISFSDDIYFTETFSDYSGFLEFVKKTYIPEFQKALLEFDDFSHGAVKGVAYVDKFGDTRDSSNIEVSFVDRF